MDLEGDEVNFPPLGLWPEFNPARSKASHKVLLMENGGEYAVNGWFWSKGSWGKEISLKLTAKTFAFSFGGFWPVFNCEIVV